jgi:hypothetical protein
MCSYMRTLPSHGVKQYRNYRFKTEAIKIHLSLHHVSYNRSIASSKVSSPESAM